jgi:excisionase family DNA binding protein
MRWTKGRTICENRDDARRWRYPVLDLMTLDEAAGELRCSKAALYRWVAEGRIKPTRVGSRLRFTRESLLDFLQNSTEQRHRSGRLGSA